MLMCSPEISPSGTSSLLKNAQVGESAISVGGARHRLEDQLEGVGFEGDQQEGDRRHESLMQNPSLEIPARVFRIFQVLAFHIPYETR